MRYRSLVIVVVVLGLAATWASADEPGRDDRLGLTKPDFGGDSSPIRPGAALDECTLNYVFYNPQSENPPAYIGTAGHCTSKVGQRISLAGGMDIGTVVYDSDRAGSDVDFSLIRIDQNKVSKTSPKVLHWGGPTGIAATSLLDVGDQLDLYGHGILVGANEATRPRSGLLTGWTATEYAADMPAVNGDSGAPVLHHDSGRALGIISRYGVTASPPSTDTGPRMAWLFAALDNAGFEELVLATAK